MEGEKRSIKWKSGQNIKRYIDWIESRRKCEKERKRNKEREREEMKKCRKRRNEKVKTEKETNKKDELSEKMWKYKER